MTESDRALSRMLDVALALPEEQRLEWVDTIADAELKARLRSLLMRASGELIDTLPKLSDVMHFRGLHEVDEIVGAYRLTGRLGAGSMGAVWSAERTDGLEPARVALKFAHVAPLRGDLQARLEREHELLRALDHPNIAKLYDAGTTDAGQPYLVLEYVDGRSLRAFVEQEQLTLEQRLQLFEQLVRAVAHAHACRIVHRDLKPANVLVTARGELRLLDFGIGKLLGSSVPDLELSRSTGHPLTPAYASPEQLLGGPVEEPSDVYSLGVLLFELLTGRRPFEGGAGLAEHTAILQCTAPPPSTLCSGLDPRLDALVAKALQREASARFASAGALLDALLALKAQAPR